MCLDNIFVTIIELGILNGGLSYGFETVCRDL